MKGYGPETFGFLNAENYDELHDPGTTDQAVDVLAGFAGRGKVLELAIGTGRVALPLAERGVAIEGVDASPDMVDQLRKKPGGDRIPVVIGDMADVPVEGTYDFIFLIFNTLFNLTSQDRQVDCFLNVGQRLNKGGAFLVETYVPDLSRFWNGKSLLPRHIGFDKVTLDAAVHDPVAQVIEHQRVSIDGNGMSLTPLPMRYAWPSEIDLMARLAGLELEERWGGWDRSPFTAKSDMHVSIYRKPRS